MFHVGLRQWQVFRGFYRKEEAPSTGETARCFSTAKRSSNHWGGHQTVVLWREHDRADRPGWLVDAKMNIKGEWKRKERKTGLEKYLKKATSHFGIQIGWRQIFFRTWHERLIPSDIWVTSAWSKPQKTNKRRVEYRFCGLITMDFVQKKHIIPARDPKQCKEVKQKKQTHSAYFYSRPKS